MTVKEKQLFRRILIGIWELFQTTDKTKAIDTIDGIVENFGNLEAPLIKGEKK